MRMFNIAHHTQSEVPQMIPRLSEADNPRIIIMREGLLAIEQAA